MARVSVARVPQTIHVLASTERSVVLELFLSDCPALHALLCENAPSALAQDWDKWRSEKPLHYSGHRQADGRYTYHRPFHCSPSRPQLKLPFHATNVAHFGRVTMGGSQVLSAEAL